MLALMQIVRDAALVVNGCESSHGNGESVEGEHNCDAYHQGSCADRNVAERNGKVEIPPFSASALRRSEPRRFYGRSDGCLGGGQFLDLATWLENNSSLSRMLPVFCSCVS